MHGFRQRVAVGLLAVVLVGCASQAPTPAGTPGGSAAPAASGSGPTAPSAPTSVKVQVGPVDAATASSLLGQPSTDANGLSTAAAALGKDVQARVNATAIYGQTATDLVSLLDGTETAALQALLDKVRAKAGTADTARLELASFRRPTGRPAAGSDMALLTVAYLFLVLAGGTGIGMYEPKAGDIPATSLSTHESKTSGDTTMDVNVSFTISSSGGVVNVSVNLTGQGSGKDTATGKSASLAGNSTIVFSINPCPDPAGRVNGTVAISDDETISSSAGPSVGYKITGTTDFLTQVNDQADIDATQMTSKIERAITTATPASGAGSPDVSAIDIAVTGTDTIGGDGKFGSGGTLNVDKVDGPAQDSDIVSIGGMVGTFGYGPPIMLSGFAKDDWRGGRCFEVRPAPDGGTVATGSATKVKVTVYHWVDKADIQVPVRATLSGAKSIDPNGTPVTSPATFTFTAGKPTATGDVTYKVVSKRGIGERTSNFKVQGSLKIDISGTYDETAFVWIYKLKVKASGLFLLVHDDGSIDIDGDVVVSGTARATLEPCTATINEKIPVHGTATLTGPDDAPVYRAIIGPASTSNLGQKITCPYISVPSNEGDFFGQWSHTLGPVDLPATGGVVTKSGSTGGGVSRQAQGTFTATVP